MWVNKKRIIFLLSFTAIFLSVINLWQNPTNADAATQNCTVPASLLTQTTGDQQLLNLINIYRQQNNLSPLTWSAILKQAAVWQSTDMGARGVLGHIDSLGRDQASRISDCGYNWTVNGENLFQGSNDPQAVFNAWKNSPPHNANMLLATAKEAGIASINSYWTLDIGASNTPIPTGSSITPTQPITSLTVTPTPSSPPSGTPSPTPTPEVNTDPTDTQITVSIKLPGIGQTGNKFPIHLTREVTVGIFDSDNKLVLTGNGFLKYNQNNLFEGTIHLGQLANGIYSIKIKSTNTLVSLVFPQFQNLTHENVNVLPFTALTAGDLNNDNTIDIKDYNLALACFQSSSCAIKVDTDLNDDSKSNVIDYNLFLSNFKQYAGD